MLIRLPSLLAAFALLTAAASAPSPARKGLEGDWRNTKNTVHLRVSRCGPAYCGTVIWAGEQQRADARKGSGKDLVGSLLLRDLRPSGPATWRGKVHVPDININVRATVVQMSDVLIRVSGCSFGIVCKTQHWHRIS
jgi:uncharacterized protein (DUF2147 family)